MCLGWAQLSHVGHIEMGKTQVWLREGQREMYNLHRERQFRTEYNQCHENSSKDG